MKQRGFHFYCGEKFVKGHECKKPKSFLMDTDEEKFEKYNERT